MTFPISLTPPSANQKSHHSIPIFTISRFSTFLSNSSSSNSQERPQHTCVHELCPPPPPPPVHDQSSKTSATHRMLRLQVSSRGLQSNSDVPTELAEAQAVDYTASQDLPSIRSHRSGTRRRRKIGKGIQLILLRSYVQCAKQLNRVPDRFTTEQLLEQGYDEFYYQGGNLNEPRLNYAAFLKLVRNRRSEVMRQTRGGRSIISQRGSARHGQKEQLEIQALINELEQVRHGRRPCGAVECDTLSVRSDSQESRALITDTSMPILSDSSSIMGDTGTDGGVSAGDLSTAETYSSVLSGTDGSNDDVVISRSKLNVMLQVAQETLVAQKRILDEVAFHHQRVLTDEIALRFAQCMDSTVRAVGQLILRSEC